MLLLAHPLIRREKMAPGSVQFSSILGYSFQCSTSVTWNFICCFGGYNSQFGMVFESCFISQCDALVICLLKWLRKKIHRYAEKLPVSMLNLGAFFCTYSSMLSIPMCGAGTSTAMVPFCLVSLTTFVISLLQDVISDLYILLL
jgi:hypothetical protein